MKLGRTTVVAGLVLGLAPAGFAGGKCRREGPRLTDGNVVCESHQVQDPADFPSTKPFNNNKFFVGTGGYRDQYYHTPTRMTAVAARAATIETFQARAHPISPIVQLVFGDVESTSGISPSTMKVTTGSGSPVPSTTFAANVGSTLFGQESGTNADPIEIDMVPGPFGWILSTCTSCPEGDAWVGNSTASGYIELDAAVQSAGLVIDFTLGFCNALGTTCIAPDTNAYWDTSSATFNVGGGCPDSWHIFSGLAFGTPPDLDSTLFAPDDTAATWVFRGRTLGPPATVQQQIAEIIRLLITPEGLRCSGLDLTADGRFGDDPLNFPSGKDYDPISPQIGTDHGDGIVTGEEANGFPRQQGWIE